MLTSDDVRRTYIDFFTRRGHVEIPGGSLVPADRSVLFTTAGIQPLVPYFGGSPHPSGRRLVDVQRCLRTVDIDEVGDDTHLTCFEMLGNWSLGDYGKRESLGWTLELLVDVFGLDFDRLTFTVHPGDDESFDRWVSLGVPPARISALEDNWWGPPGPSGPCGPDSEVFYDGIEIANNVFITHQRLLDGSCVRLPQDNVDVGMGLERITSVVQGVSSVYDTDIFAPAKTKGRPDGTDLFARMETGGRAERIVADHLRSSLWLIEDGVLPSNTDQGYVLRRLIRRAIRQGRTVGIELRELTANEVVLSEERRFAATLRRGLREVQRLRSPTGRDLFRLFETYGFPPELTAEELGGLDGWEEEFSRALEEHRERSRVGSDRRFG
jgi:alanyl-tRNA synthetase